MAILVYFVVCEMGYTCQCSKWMIMMMTNCVLEQTLFLRPIIDAGAV